MSVSVSACYRSRPSLRGETRVRPKSRVWRYFQELPEKNQARCLICDVLFVFRGHSSNLHKHLKRKHPQQYEDLAFGLDASTLPASEILSRSRSKPKSKMEKIVNLLASEVITKKELPSPTDITLQPVNTSVIDTAQPAGVESERKKTLDQKLVAMIALDLQLVSLVEDRGFVDFMKVADSTYNLPSKKTILNELLPNLYNSMAEVTNNKLEGARKIALTTDLWCAQNRADYLTLSAHFISLPEWNSNSINLSTSIFYGSYTGEDVAHEIEQSVARWNLTDKVTMMITDSATNMLLAHENLPWGIIPCLAHLIHLVVSDAISEDIEVSSLIERVQDVVNFFYYNKEASQKLADMQVSLGMPGKKLPQGMIMRWNSIFKMFERLIEQWHSVNSVLTQMGREEKCLSSADQEMMALTLASLKPFDIAAKTLSQGKRNTNNIGMAMPLMECLQKMMTSLKGSIMEPFTTSLKAGLVKRFEQMWKSEWLIAATLLDPRYKKFPFGDKALKEKAMDNIVGEVSFIIEENQEIAERERRMNGDVFGENEEDVLWNFLNDNDAENAQESANRAPISAAYREVHRYLETPPLPRKECPLLYWKQHVELFPSLNQVALKYMGVPTTSSSSDKFFSKAGEMMAEKKTRLKPQSLDMVLFLNRNLP